MNERTFAATPRSSNGFLVGVENSLNIVLVRTNGERFTVTNVEDLIDALREAKINRTILEDRS